MFICGHNCNANMTLVDFLFTINNWPTYNNCVAATLNAMQDTYHILPIPVYMQRCGLMYPLYTSINLLVLPWSSTSCWPTGSFQKDWVKFKALDVCNAKLLCMHIVWPPLPAILLLKYYVPCHDIAQVLYHWTEVWDWPIVVRPYSYDIMYSHDVATWTLCI